MMLSVMLSSENFGFRFLGDCSYGNLV